MKLFSVLLLMGLSAHAQVMPILEVRINNTSRTKDDYVGSDYVPCNVRLINGASFSQDSINLTLRNYREGIGRVTFSQTDSGESAQTLKIAVNKDNSFTEFYIKADRGSITDKDAAIEAVDSREIVLARKAFMVGENPLPLTRPRIELEINTLSTLDDYVTWAPTLCRARVSNYSSFSEPVTVTFTSAGIGKVNFATAPLAAPVSDPAITLSLPNSATWVSFYISGRFGNPSIQDKDAIIEFYEQETGLLLGREALMVRVRKNANNLTDGERDRFTAAIFTLNNRTGGYTKFIDTHSVAKLDAHKGPGFLPWHRAFILDLERELQRLDPGVTLPYWKFDEPAENIFSRSFMGTRSTIAGFNFASFDIDNPLSGWNINGGLGIRRKTKFTNDGEPSVRSELATLALGNTFSEFEPMELNPHGQVHLQAGNSGDWIINLSTAVRDPLFFLLHANVDRQWARWQWLNNRFDATDVRSYSAQGSFLSSGNIHIGHYLNDTMWTWNGRTGNGTDALGDRPTTAPIVGFPNAVSFNVSPLRQPRPLDMIDYRDGVNMTTTNQGLGFCYDDVPY